MLHSHTTHLEPAEGCLPRQEKTALGYGHRPSIQLGEERPGKWKWPGGRVNQCVALEGDIVTT